jgi:hypothetical protein
MSASRIELADEAEERAAADALRAARTKDELVSAWWHEADHFQGAARERLQEEYATRLREFAPMSRAG